MLRHRFGCSAFYLPAVLGLLFSNPTARANPTGAQVVNGAVSMETIGNTLKITAPDRSIIHWQNFSIGAGETTQFIQPGAMATVLNRVTSGEASHLMGTLQANGRVYLLNPNGIFIGNGAVVDVGSFMATTAHLTDEAFLKGGDFQLSGASDAPIRNAGKITAHNGDVFLLAQVVENTGTIRAAQGTVGLMAGRDFYVKKEEAGSVKVMVKASDVPGAKQGIGVDNRGTIEALRANLEADGNVYALAINQAGVVRATGVNQLADGTVTLSAPGGKIFNSGQLIAANQNGSGGKISAAGTEVVFAAASLATAAGAVDGGEVKIAAEGDNLVSGQVSADGATGKAGRIELTGNRVGLFDAELTADGATGGGEVLVGGDYQGLNPLVKNASRTFVSQDSVISADATIEGDGGKVIVWSDNGTQFYGHSSVRGGALQGNGGLVEVSGRDYLDYRGTSDRLAPNGKNGLLLLDPTDMTITLDSNVNVTANPPFVPDTASGSELGWDRISTDLALGNVLVTTAAGFDAGEPGTITFAANGSYNSVNNLTFTAAADADIITTGFTITNAGSGSVSFNVSGMGTIQLGGNITTAGGAVTFTGPTVLTGNAAIDTTNAGVAAGANISFSSTLDGAQDLNLTAGTGTVTFTGAVGGNTELGDLTIITANDVTFQSTLLIGAYIQQAGTGITEFQANLETGAGFSFTGNELTFEAASGNNVVGGDMTISNTGAFTLDVGATLASAGVFEQNGAGVVSLGGDVSSAGAMTFGSDVTLAGTVELQNLGGDLQLLGAVDGGFDLSLSSAGNVTFGGAVGGNTELGDLTIITANDVTFQSTLLIGAYIQQAGTGITEFQGNLETGLGFSFTGNEVTFAAGSGNNVVGGDMTISNTGAFTLDDGGATLASAGVFEQNGAGAVTLGGDVSSADAMTFGSDVTLTAAVELQNAAGNLELTSTVNGPHDLTVTSAGDVTFGGAVGGGTALTSLAVTGNTIAINGGEVTTDGVTGQVYTGAVTLGVATTLTTAGHDVTFTGAGSTLSGAQSLTIDAGAGAVTFGGAVGTGALTALSSLTVTGDSIALNGGEVETTGSQTYTGAVTLGDDTTLTTTDSDVTFSSTIRNTIAQTLTIAAGTGTVTFGGAVGGGATALQSLEVTGVGGTVLMDGGAVTTTGLQSYTGTVDLGADTTLTTSGGNITFGSDITGAGFNLDLTTGAGDIDVTGAVGSDADILGDLTIVSARDVTFLSTLDVGAYIQQAGTGITEFQANLETGAGFSFTGNELTFASGSGNNVVGGDMTISNTGGAFTLDVGATLASAGVFELYFASAVNLGGDVSSADAMTFGTAITLTAAVELQNAAGNLELTSTVNGPHDLTVTSAGEVTFGEGVGGGTALSSLNVTGTTIAINGGGVRTTGLQSYTGPVMLRFATELTTTDSDVTFTGATSTISGAQVAFSPALTIAAGTGTVTFGAAVGAGALTALTSLEVTGGTIAVNGGEVETTGSQTYTGAVTLGDDTTLTTTDSDVTFSSTIENAVAQTLTIAAGTGTVTFGGGVGGGATALQSLEVTGVGGTVLMDGGAVRTTGLQSYTGTVDLGADTTLTTSGGNITFGSDITGAGFNFDLTTGAGDITVTGAVGSDSAILGDLTIVSARDVTFLGTLDVGAYIQQAGTGITEFQGNLETGLGFSFTGNELTFEAASGDNVVGGDMTISNSGAFTLDDGATLAAAGIFEQSGSGAVTLGGDVSSADAMTFGSAITLTAAVELQNAANALILQSTVAGAHALTVTSAGEVTFGEGVGTGGLTALTSLTVTGNTIAINGGGVRTTGLQSYTGPVMLGAATELTTADSNVTFTGATSTISGAQALTIAAGTGTVTFGAAVGAGALTALTSLEVTGGTIAVNGGEVETTGSQTYTGAVTLGDDTTLTTLANGAVTFFGGTSTINNAQTLTINANGTGVVTLGGAVGGGTALTSLEVTGTTIAINGGAVTTAGVAGQTYNGAVTLGANSNLNAGAGNLVTFSSTVNGASDLAIGGTSNVRFDGLVGGGVALTSLTVGGNTAINTTAIRTAGNQTYTGAVSAGTVSFTAGTGGIDLRNAGNDFTGNVTIVSASAITLRDANALSLAGAVTTAGQVFVAGGNLTTSGAYAISGVGDLLLESEAGQVTLGAGTSYTGRNITMVAGDNQSFVNQAGAAPFNNTGGGRTLVFSTKARINSPTQLNGGFSGFQPYFNTVPDVVVGPALGTYTVLNSLPGGNLMVYRSPGSSPVHPDHVPQATVNSIVNTEAFQTAVPILTYSLFTVPRSTVEIRYRMSPDQGARATPDGFRPRLRESGRPSAEANRRPSNDMGRAESQGREVAPLRLGEISIQGPRVSLAPSAPVDSIY